MNLDDRTTLGNLHRLYGPDGTFIGHIQIADGSLEETLLRQGWVKYMVPLGPIEMSKCLSADVTEPLIIMKTITLAFDRRNEGRRLGVRLVEGAIDDLEKMPEFKVLPSMSYIRSMMAGA